MDENTEGTNFLGVVEIDVDLFVVGDLAAVGFDVKIFYGSFFYGV